MSAPKKKSTNFLSKSRYIRGIQCHKSLWLYTHELELRCESDDATARFQQGNEVGELARNIFPGGVLFEYGDLPLDEQITATKIALTICKVIYEGTFNHDGVLVKADILKKGRGGWELYEVKASTELKEVYLDDVAVQYYVLSGAGVSITKAFIVHVNNSYVRAGALDLKALFKIIDVSADIRERQSEVKKEIARQKRLLKGNEPAIDIGPWCSDPYDCDFKGHCWQHIPENSVFDLANYRKDKQFALYNKGIIRLQDIPLDQLKGKQLQQVEVFSKKKTTVDKKGLREFLDEIWYPLYFLDFETFQAAIPPYDGLKPYQQIPFQFSLHYLKMAGGKLHHEEFLASPGVDPRKELLGKLTGIIPEDAFILAFNKSFESMVLKDLAVSFPRKKKLLRKFIDNMVDLADPFRKRHLYSWKQQGSYSIKKVLPVFVKGMSYEGMEIADGGAAMQAYHEMCTLQNKPKELAKLRQALLEYCEQDTLAMVKLLEILKEKSN